MKDVSKMIKCILIAIGLWVLVWIGSLTIVIPSFASTLEAKPFLMLLVVLSVELATALLIIWVISRGNWSKYGFKLNGNLMILKVLITGLIIAIPIGLIETLIENVIPMGEFKFTPTSLLQSVLILWIFASFTEEVVFRGLIQSYLSEHIKSSFNLFRWRITFPALIGAIFFSLSHVVLLFQATDLHTLYIILTAFIIGITAGYFRDKTGSLLGPFIIHALPNIIGTISALV
jgi:hypothetical protein